MKPVKTRCQHCNELFELDQHNFTLHLFETFVEASYVVAICPNPACWKNSQNFCDDTVLSKLIALQPLILKRKQPEPEIVVAFTLLFGRVPLPLHFLEAPERMQLVHWHKQFEQCGNSLERYLLGLEDLDSCVTEADFERLCPANNRRSEAA